MSININMILNGYLINHYNIGITEVHVMMTEHKLIWIISVYQPLV